MRITNSFSHVRQHLIFPCNRPIHLSIDGLCPSVLSNVAKPESNPKRFSFVTALCQVALRLRYRHTPNIRIGGN